MDAAYVDIARRLKFAKDIVKFASLSTGTLRVVSANNLGSASITVTERALERGVVAWLAAHGEIISRLSIQRCDISSVKFENLESVRFLYCRVTPTMLRAVLDFPARLTHLRIHQMEPGDDPGCLTTILAPCTSLRELSVTCTRRWGIASIGTLNMPQLEHLEIRAQHTLIYARDFPPNIKYLRLHADDLYIPEGIRLPKKCVVVDIRSRNSDLQLDSIFQGGPYMQLKTFTLESLVIFPKNISSQAPFLERFMCKCQIFVFQPLPMPLNHLEIDVNSCYVCDTTMTPDNIQQIKTIPYIRVTERSRVCNVDDLLW